ncbi:hypothetical protein KJ766_03755 [Patescibacteria group bacterium]|nr:hypothetical protein [Patescibacteria group bacterium]
MTKGNKPMSRTLRIYQKAAIAFIIVALLSLLVVLYLSVSRASIHITPIPSVVSTTVSVDVTPQPKTVGQVSGYILERNYQKAKTFFVPEEGAVAQEQHATGIVTLINDTDNDQQLIATTRLMSEEGVLFRLQDSIVVPASGQLEAVAYADKMGLEGEIGPTQFIIPGLPASLQADIYAVSTESMAGGVQYVREVSTADLNGAVDQLTEEILLQAEDEMIKEINDDEFDGSALEATVTERVTDVTPGEEAGSFSVSLTVKVDGIFYDKSVIAEYAQAELYSQIQDGYEILSMNQEGMQVKVKTLNIENKIASLEVYLDGFAVISTSSDLLDRGRLVSKSPQEVIALLQASEDIETVRVTFTPFWLKRLPTLKDHIKIDIDAAK